ncbi:MAG: hypothetical protein HOH47_04950, partial [Flavobacteriaceae bacterium]|nr:hypothetical protein [Flavobacteriaceae bacterium]
MILLISKDFYIFTEQRIPNLFFTDAKSTTHTRHIPSTKIVKAVFDYNQELIPLVGKQKGAPWSQTQAQHRHIAHSIDRCMPFESTTLIQQPLYYT